MQVTRCAARRVAWIGTAIGGGTTALIGAAAAIFPQAWIGLFSNDPVVIETGTQYLRTVAPFYGFFGVGMMIYFASQGADRVAIPFIGGLGRLILAGGIGWIVAAKFGVALPVLFAIVAGSYALYALVCVAGMKVPGWGIARRR